MNIVFIDETERLARKRGADSRRDRGVARESRPPSVIAVAGTPPFRGRLVDVVVPLGVCSAGGKDEELKILLRSLAENATGWDRAWIVATRTPGWLREDDRLRVVPMDDPFRHNKCANILRKLREGLRRTDKGEVVISCDDIAVCQPLDLSALPPVYNARDIECVERDAAGSGKWTKKLLATMRRFGMTRGNWDSHVPQRWPVAAAQSIIDATEAEWAVEDREDKGLGLSSGSVVFGHVFCGTIPQGAVDQNTAKETVESEDAVRRVKLDRWFVGWNDAGWTGGLREVLFGRFPEKSQWEK